MLAEVGFFSRLSNRQALRKVLQNFQFPACKRDFSFRILSKDFTEYRTDILVALIYGSKAFKHCIHARCFTDQTFGIVFHDICQDSGIEYRTDSTNRDDGPLRNWIRLQLLPELRERIDFHLDERLAHLSDIFREEDEHYVWVR